MSAKEMNKMKILGGNWESGELTLVGMPIDYVLSAREVYVCEIAEIDRLTAEKKRIEGFLCNLSETLSKTDPQQG